MSKAKVNFQHRGVWYGPDHGDKDVPKDVVNEVGPHVLDGGQIPDEIAENADAVKNAPPSEERDKALGELANSGGAPSDAPVEADAKAEAKAPARKTAAAKKD